MYIANFNLLLQKGSIVDPYSYKLVCCVILIDFGSQTELASVQCSFNLFVITVAFESISFHVVCLYILFNNCELIHITYMNT